MSPRFAFLWVVGFLLPASGARAQSNDDWSHAPEPPPPGLASPPEPPPPEPPAAPRTPRTPFGSRGQWVISGSSSVAASSTSYDRTSASNLGVTFSPHVDRFMLRNLSLGLLTTVAFGDGKGYGADSSLVETRTTTVRLGPRVGLNVPLTQVLSLWPTLALGFEWTQRTQSLVSGSSLSVGGNPLGYPSTTEFGPWLDIDVALLLHPRPHFYLGLDVSGFRDFGHVQGGPDVGGQQTSLNAGFVLGGWFGGESAELGDPAAPDAPAPAGRARRFGDRGVLVLSDELALYGGWTGNEGSPSTASSEGMTIGADFFAADRVSMGISLSAAHGASTSVDPTTSATVTSESTGYSSAIRIGVDIPFAGAFSFWPRAAIGAGSQSISVQESSQLRNDIKFVTAVLFAPVLVHPASHFLVGFGPRLQRDLSRDIGVTSTGGFPQTISTPTTTIGAGFMVAGWL
jgi:hypothetical protein